MKKSPYNPKFVAKIKRGDKDILKGNTIKITLDEIKLIHSLTLKGHY